MRAAILKILKKPTLFLFLGILTIVLGLPAGIYGLTLSGGASLGGAIILTAVAIAFIILMLDRIIVRTVNPLYLSIVELLIGSAYMLNYLYDNKKVLVDLEDYDSDYFVLIESSDLISQAEVKSGFLFDKHLKPSTDFSIISADIKNDYRIKVNPPDSWDGLVSMPWNYQDIRVSFYHSRNTDYEAGKIDSLVEKSIKSVANNRIKQGL